MASAASLAGGGGGECDDLLSRALGGGPASRGVGEAGSGADVVQVAVFADDVHGSDAAGVAVLREACMARVAAALPRGFVWTREPLVLEADDAAAAEAGGRAALTCGLRVAAGSAEDAWAVARVLAALTAALPALSARVVDADGEFLLIEAADLLPPWLEPATAPRRAWLRGGHLQLLSPGRVPGAPPALAAALDALTAGQGEELVGAQVLFEERYRAAAPPPHVARVRLPLGAAAALRASPALVGAAAEALDQRDPSDVATALGSRVAAPGAREGATGRMVDAMIPMHRLHYAQTLAQRVAPPKAWQPLVPAEAGAARQAALLGMKLCLGLAMVAKREESCDDEQGDDDGEAAVSRGWAALRGALEAQGRLAGGDLQHDAVLSRASARFEATTALALRQRAALHAPHAAVEAALAAVDAGESRAETVAPVVELREGDSDAWMFLEEAELEKELEARRQGGSSGDDHANGASAAAQQSGSAPAFDVAQAAEGVRRFVASERAGEGGAELPAGVGGVGLDPDAFVKELRGALGLAGGAAGGEGVSEAASESETDDEYDADGEPLEGGAPLDSDAFTREYDAALREQMVGAGGTAATGEEGPTEGGAGEEDDEAPGEEDDEAPLNVDLGVVQNLLASYASQGGLPGPASNLLGAMGMRMPDTDVDS